MSAIFGTAGLSESFEKMGFSKNTEIPLHLQKFGLTAFEYQCGRGVRLSQAGGQAILKADPTVTYSVHAPYYISMSSLEVEKRDASVNYMLQSAAAVRSLGGRRAIFHAGSAGKQSREQALTLAIDTMYKMVEAMAREGYEDIIMCPETMGKINQLGDLDEVLALCRIQKNITPCIDFGHLNCRTMGGLKTKRDYADILDKMALVLQDERASNFHAHFSKIEYTAGGEKKHLTFADSTFGPEFEPLMELIAQRNLSPVIICESDGTQAEDAASMQNYYKTLLKA